MTTATPAITINVAAPISHQSLPGREVTFDSRASSLMPSFILSFLVTAGALILLPARRAQHVLQFGARRVILLERARIAHLHVNQPPLFVQHLSQAHVAEFVTAAHDAQVVL